MSASMSAEKTRHRDQAMRPRSTIARVGRAGLALAVLVLARIGFLHLTRGTAVRHVRGVTADAPIGIGEPEFPLVVTMRRGWRQAIGST